MEPQPGSSTIQIPITFDYKGGRNENSKNKWIVLIILTVVSIVVSIGVLRNDKFEIWKKILFECAFLYIILAFLRFIIFKEIYYSDIFETLKETKNVLPTSYMWSIFDIDLSYPYIVYYRNGMKGIFVKMEKDAITGKGADAQYDHYEAISEAYNLCHQLSMDIRHIDYMDNVGNDSRVQLLYDQLKQVENPDMRDMLTAIYDNLEEEMSRNYSSFDIYLYITRDKTESFIYNVQSVSNMMLGGNFITYRILNKNDIRTVCMALFNLHDFSVINACEEVLRGKIDKGVIPIRVIDEEGNEEKLNKTQEELRIEAEIRRQEELDKEAEAKAEKERKKKKLWRKKKDDKVEVADDEDLNLFE